MEEDIQRFYPLGNKTLTMLILKKSFMVVFLFVVMILALFYLQYIPDRYVGIALYMFFGYIVIFIFFSVFVFFLGWLEYIRYEIVLGDKSLTMQRGLIRVEQVGIPYRHIQDIKIERSLLDQIIGVSEIMVTISGTEQQEIHPGEKMPGQIHKIILPAVERNTAHQIQEIVLGRAQVQQFDIANRM